MALKAVLLLASFVGLAYSATPSCSGIDDCNCADKAYAECDEPPTGDNIHVTTWQECKAQCDLFASFGACEWFLFDQQQGMDENCHLFSPSRESMPDYLHTCNIVMAPLRNLDGACFAASCSDTDTAHCPGGCASCAGDDCEFYVETECSKNGEETSFQNNIPDAAFCATILTSQGSENLSYYTYNKRNKECTGYADGERNCVNAVAMRTMTEPEIENLSYYTYNKRNKECTGYA